MNGTEINFVAMLTTGRGHARQTPREGRVLAATGLRLSSYHRV
jgi:hypothetical protein